MTNQSSISNAIFLTGATGLVGGLLIRRLVEQNPKQTIFALVRRSSGFPRLPTVHYITGDISRPRLGLTRDVYAQLCTSVGTIVHCAASTKFTLPLCTSRKVNVHGTENVLELARRAKKLKLLLHISTAYVAGRKSGLLREAQFAHPDGWFNPYEQSKFEAERLVIEKGSGIPWAIVRLSTIVGNSLTGKVSQFNYFHQLLRIVPTYPLPVIPGAPQTPVDVIADDWVVEGLGAILRGQPAPGSVFHLCAGPLQALPAQEVVELAFRLHHQQQPSSALRMPAFVSLDEFQALAKGLRRSGQTGLSRMAELLLLYLPHLDVHQSFLNENTNSFLEDAGISALRTHDFLPRIVQACF